MLQKVYSVFDNAAKAFLPPFFLPEEAMAIRTFSDCVNSDTHQFGLNPGDYTLMYLGEFEQSSGLFNSMVPEKVINGLEVPKKENERQVDAFKED